MRGGIVFENLSYYVQVHKERVNSLAEREDIERVSGGNWFCGAKGKRVILRNVSGYVAGGSLLAVMGATGSGKTTLLDCLAGRKEAESVSGRVFLDGVERSALDLRGMCGYVVQETVLPPFLTVREALLFSARLRLKPGEESLELCEARVAQVIKELNLSKVADSIITGATRGLSGGELKRVMIAAELVRDPKVLFLDEPTTGLDASTARSVMRTLHRLARSGTTIVCTIHQPRSSILEQIDRVLLLGEGKVAFLGTVDEALSHFASVGYIRPRLDNPADFFLDTLVEEQRIRRQGGDDVEEGVGVPESGALSEHAIELVDPSSKASKPLLCEVWPESEKGQEVQREVATVTSSAAPEDKAAPASFGPQRSIWVQWLLLSWRTWLSTSRDPAQTYGKVIAQTMIAIINGAVFFGLGYDTPAIQNRLGAMFFLSIGNVFGNGQAIGMYLSDAKLYSHEAAAGYYSSVPFFFARVFVEALPARIVEVAIGQSITYWMIGLNDGIDNFFVYMLVFYLLNINAAGVAFAAAALGGNLAAADGLSTLVYTTSMLFSGYLINLDTMPPIIAGISRISFFRYAFEVLVVNEFKDTTFTCGTSPGSSPFAPQQSFSSNTTITSSCKVSGNSIIEGQGIDPNWVWPNVAILAAMAVFFFSISFFTLRTLHK